MTISREIVLIMKIVSNNNSRENQNMHFMLHIFFPENRSRYEIMSKNMLEA